MGSDQHTRDKHMSYNKDIAFTLNTLKSHSKIMSKRFVLIMFFKDNFCYWGKRSGMDKICCLPHKLLLA